MKRKAYEELAILPNMLAVKICFMPYTGAELSAQVRDGSAVARTEKLRQEMSFSDVRKFSDWCDRRCKAAYNARADWFAKCIHHPPKLAMWLSHWLASFLNNPAIAERE